MAEALVSTVAHLRAGVYTSAAGCTILLYDIIITSEDEIRLVWASSFSLVKCLYFVNRYLPVPCLILGMYLLADFRGPVSTTFCKVVTLSQIAGQIISLIAATWLLVLRVIALYGGNKILAIALYFVFIVTHAVTLVLNALIMSEIWASFEYLPSLGSCAANPSPLVGEVYFVSVICEVVLVVLQLFHAYQHTRRLLIKPRLPITPLLRTLYADGFAYFVVVVTLRLWSGFLFMTLDYSYWYLSTYLEFALISTSISRLVLHLRRVAEVHRQVHLDPGTSIPLSQLTQSVNRNSKFHNNQNWTGRQPPKQSHHYRRTPFSDHPLSSFQGTGETIQTHPPPIPQVHFSPLDNILGAESITSTGTSVIGASKVGDRVVEASSGSRGDYSDSER